MGQKGAGRPPGRKSKQTAAKVALMKMKQKAIGDKGIPEVDKLYFNVTLPDSSAQVSMPLFFSKVRNEPSAFVRLTELCVYLIHLAVCSSLH